MVVVGYLLLPGPARPTYSSLEPPRTSPRRGRPPRWRVHGACLDPVGPAPSLVTRRTSNEPLGAWWCAAPARTPSRRALSLTFHVRPTRFCIDHGSSRPPCRAPRPLGAAGRDCDAGRLGVAPERSRVREVHGPWSDARRDVGRFRRRHEAAYHARTMSTPVHARATEATTDARGTPGTRAGTCWHIRGGRFRTSSLAQRFLLANLVILLVAGLAVGCLGGRSARAQHHRPDGLGDGALRAVDHRAQRRLAGRRRRAHGRGGAPRSTRISRPAPSRTRSARCASGPRTAASSTAPIASSSAGPSRSSATSRRPGPVDSWPAWTT